MGSIFGGLTNTTMSHIHLYKELEEEQVGAKFTEKKDFC